MQVIERSVFGDYCVEDGMPKMVETHMFFKTTKALIISASS